MTTPKRKWLQGLVLRLKPRIEHLRRLCSPCEVEYRIDFIAMPREMIVFEANRVYGRRRRLKYRSNRDPFTSGKVISSEPSVIRHNG
jgi:hypothetical protein